jgi:tetratricopeptide (TPR) repeat protein
MPNKTELEVLPAFCRVHPNLDFVGNYASSEPERAESDRWEGVFGEDYQHLHHYCWALLYVRRANQYFEPVVRDAILDAAISEFQYVIANASRNLVFRPEVHVRKGLALVLRGNTSLAAREYLAAIQLRPDYTPAYSALSDCYVELNDLDEAQKILEQGLKRVPGSEMLKKKLGEIKTKKATGS